MRRNLFATLALLVSSPALRAIGMGNRINKLLPWAYQAAVDAPKAEAA